MKIAICQINPIIGDFEYNISLIKDATDQAKKSGCVLAVFPEMCITGYPAKDLLEKPDFIKENIKQLNLLPSNITDISMLCGYIDRNPKKTGNPLINSVALIKDGKVVAKGDKRLLSGYGAYDETRYFEPCKESLIFELDGKKCGVTICKDTWSESDITDSNIDIFINVSASPYSLGKPALRLNILKKLSQKYKIPAIFCNQVGGNDDLLFDGSSMVVDANGRLICLGRQFESDLLYWDTEKEYKEISDPWPPEEESVLIGLIMGTRDYASKCGFEKVLVGLSGGLDSSLVAFIASEAMGAKNVIGVSMPSPYTSEISKEDARELAKNLDISFEEIPIHDLIQVYKKALGPLFKSLKEDETEENIQARIRANILMAMSNKYNALLLATGNKSELAVGYCTLYGDLSGGLAVISDIPKTMCYRVADFINKKNEIIPKRVISRPPSAELRPNQTDQDTLPPYDVLDDILEATLEKNLGFDDIVERGHDPAIVKDVLRRLAYNEYKRRQAPLGLRITAKPFGSGRSYPIARGRQVF